MLIEALLGVVSLIIKGALTVLQLPDLPDTIKNTALDVVLWIARGCQIVAAFTDFTYLLALLTFVLMLSGVFTAYHIVMWIVHKIPFLNIH